MPGMGLSGSEGGGAVIRSPYPYLVGAPTFLSALPTRLGDYKINAAEAAEKVRARFAERTAELGEHRDLEPDAVAAILRSRA